MPAFTQSFLVACRGTSHDAVNQKMVASPANGGASLEIVLLDEKLMTFRPGGGVVGFPINATAHALLSDPNTVVLQNGVGFTIGAQSYSGVIDPATSELQISEVGQ